MRARCGRAVAGRWSLVDGKQAAVGFSLFVVRNTNFGLSSKRTFRIVIPSGAGESAFAKSEKRTANKRRWFFAVRRSQPQFRIVIARGSEGSAFCEQRTTNARRLSRRY